MDTSRHVSVRDLVGYRLQELRKRRGLTAQQFADRCATRGAPQLTRNFVTSLETRRRGLTVDDFIALAYSLDTAPMALLDLSENLDEVVDVTSTVQVSDTEQWRNWLVGDAALEGSDSRLYYGTELERMQAPGGQAMSAYARALVLERHRELAAMYDKQANEFLARVRGQMLAFIDDVAEELRSGASADQALSRLAEIRGKVVGHSQQDSAAQLGAA